MAAGESSAQRPHYNEAGDCGYQKIRAHFTQLRLEVVRLALRHSKIEGVFFRYFIFSFLSFLLSTSYVNISSLFLG